MFGPKPICVIPLNFFTLTIVGKLKNYERVTRSLLLIIIKATAISITTRPPATKLDIKFANEAVISNSVIF